MRLLSMSDTFNEMISETRRPAPWATLSAALYLDARHRLQEAHDLLLAQHDRRLARLVDEASGAAPRRADRGSR